MSSDTSGSTAPDTVVLVHGLWMTPRSWEGWVQHYQEKGLTVVTPAYPGFEVEVEALREDPQVIADLTVPETVDHLAAVITALDRPPIIMGHSFGGVLSQMLLARGLGAAGVVIDSAPTEGVRVTRRPRRGRCSPPSRTPRTGTAPSGSPPRSSTTRSPTRSRRRSRAPCGTGTRSLPPDAGSGTTA